MLYHGTPYAAKILEQNVLKYARIGMPAVSLTRSRKVAEYFAALPRDDAEARSAILVFDRQKLQTRYRLEPFDYAFSDGGPYGYGARSEAEECIWERDIEPLSRFLSSVEWL